jgi:rRNA processing protein Gar1
MKRLGTVRNIMRDGSLLLRITEDVALGTAVFNARGERIGKVTKVFGPVSEPYATVRAEQPGTESLSLLDSEAFFDPSGGKGAGKKRG